MFDYNLLDIFVTCHQWYVNAFILVMVIDFHLFIPDSIEF